MAIDEAKAALIEGEANPPTCSHNPREPLQLD